MRQKAILIFLMIVIIVIIGIVYYIAQKEQSRVRYGEKTPIDGSSEFQHADISNWQTFTNTKYAYEIKYPKDFFIGCGERTDDVPEECVEVFVYNQNDPYMNLSISVRDPKAFDTLTVEQIKTMNLSLHEYAEKIWRINKSNESKDQEAVSDFVETSLAGQKVYRFSVAGKEETELGWSIIDNRLVFVFMKHQQGFNIIFNFEERHQVYFNNILSTFRFIK